MNPKGMVLEGRGGLMGVTMQEANLIALLKSLLTSLLRFTVLKNSIYKTKKLNREVNRLFNRAIEFASCLLIIYVSIFMTFLSALNGVPGHVQLLEGAHRAALGCDHAHGLRWV